jgi:MFS family permease
VTTTAPHLRPGSVAASGRPQQPETPTLSPGYRFLLAGFTLSSAGSGLVLPLTAVFISQELGLGPAGAARYFAVVALVAAVLTPVTGRLLDRIQPRLVAVAGLAMLALGFGALGAARTPAQVLACAAAVGAGNALMLPALTPNLAAVVPAELRREAFSVRYAAMNLGIGIGAAVGGVAVSRLHSTTGFEALYLADALTFVPLAFALFRVGARTTASTSDKGTDKPVSYATLARSVVARRLIVLQFLVMAFGYAQFEASVPLLVHQRMGAGSWMLGAIVGANTVAVIGLRKPLTKRFSAYSEATTLVVGTAAWTLAFATGALAALWSGPARLVFLLLFALGFAVGETAYSCSFFPLLTRIVPEALLGRASALSSLAGNAGSVVGPLLGTLLVASAPAAAAWAALAAATLAASAIGLLLRRATPPHDSVPA